MNLIPMLSFKQSDGEEGGILKMRKDKKKTRITIRRERRGRILTRISVAMRSAELRFTFGFASRQFAPAF